jgi:predicted transcriptional regulator
VIEDLDDLVRRSANFGYLIGHEPILAYDGASAESYIYTDPDVALFKARRFLDNLSKKVAIASGSRTRAGSLAERIDDLQRHGVIDDNVRKICDEIRRVGNRAVHSGLGDVQVALDTVRGCFDLGLWLHNTVTQGQDIKVFVAPPDPGLASGQENAGDESIAEEIRNTLAAFEARLAQVLNEAGMSAPQAATELMESEQRVGEYLRRVQEQIEVRFNALQSDIDQRFYHDRDNATVDAAVVCQSGARASEILRIEANRLAELIAEITKGTRVPDVPEPQAPQSVINIAGARSQNFVVGNVYGGTLSQNVNRDPRQKK